MPANWQEHERWRAGAENPVPPPPAVEGPGDELVTTVKVCETCGGDGTFRNPYSGACGKHCLDIGVIALGKPLPAPSVRSGEGAPTHGLYCECAECLARAVDRAERVRWGGAAEDCHDCGVCVSCLERSRSQFEGGAAAPQGEAGIREASERVAQIKERSAQSLRDYLTRATIPAAHRARWLAELDERDALAEDAEALDWIEANGLPDPKVYDGYSLREAVKEARVALTPSSPGGNGGV